MLGSWDTGRPQVPALTAALGTAVRGKKGSVLQGPWPAWPFCRSHQQRHQLVLIRKVLGLFNLFCFPDVDTRPGKSGLRKTACSGRDTLPRRQLFSRRHRARPRQGALMTALYRADPLPKAGCEWAGPQAAFAPGHSAPRLTPPRVIGAPRRGTSPTTARVKAQLMLRRKAGMVAQGQTACPFWTRWGRVV